MPTELLDRVDWDLIYPTFAERCFDLAANCRARGVDYWAISGNRSLKEQEALWQKGRDATGAVVDPKSVVTNVKVGNHNFGIAVDWARDRDTTKAGLQPGWSMADYAVLAEEAKKLDLDAGYYWKTFPDPGHVQLNLAKHGLTIGKLRHILLMKDLRRVWEYLDQFQW
jgi:peptidoglycan L-alanyl-D-glutamate endopeptidase CwlK